MSVAIWLVDAADTLRGMAREYTEDENDIHLLTHGAILVLLRQRTMRAAPTEVTLAAALTVSAHELAEAEQATPPMVSRRSLEWTSHAP